MSKEVVLVAAKRHQDGGSVIDSCTATVKYGAWSYNKVMYVVSLKAGPSGVSHQVLFRGPDGERHKMTHWFGQGKEIISGASVHYGKCGWTLTQANGEMQFLHAEETATHIIVTIP
jgi:hypothetical protein